MLRPIRRVALTAALGTTLALGAGTASASAATTIGDLPDSAPLVNKLYVPVALTVTCDPDPYYSMGYGSVTIRQVVAGKQIAHGTATVGSMTCDGLAHEYIVNVFPDSSTGTISPPFAKGAAVISAQVSTGSGYDSAGPEEIRLGK